MPRYRMEEGSIQHRFQLCRKQIQMFGGGYGNGKTAALCIKIIGLAMDYPGSNGLVARSSYVKLNDTIRKEFYKWIPPGAVERWPTTTDNTMILKNGSVINFRYLGQRGKKTVDGQSTSNQLSATYDYIAVDQIEDPELTHKDFLDMIGRLRGGTPYKGSDPTMPMTGPRWLLINCNPTANWVYQKIVKPYHLYKATGAVSPDLIADKDTGEPLIEIFEGSTYTNALNLDPDYLQKMEAAYRGQMRKRFLLGEWASFEGLVYPEFTIESHMVPQKDMLAILNETLRTRNKFRGVQSLDIGLVQPGCYLCGFVDDYGRVFVIDGFYEPANGWKTLAAHIKQLQELYNFAIEWSEPIWADPAIFRDNVVMGTSVTSIAKILKNDEGLYLKPAQNNIKSGILKVATYLTNVDGGDYRADRAQGPMIYYADHLGFVADEYLGYYWKSNPQGDRVDEPIDRNDHAMDATKYLLSRLPEATELLYKRPLLTPEYMRWHEAP